MFLHLTAEAASQRGGKREGESRDLRSSKIGGGVVQQGGGCALVYVVQHLGRLLPSQPLFLNTSSWWLVCGAASCASLLARTPAHRCSLCWRHPQRAPCPEVAQRTRLCGGSGAALGEDMRTVMERCRLLRQRNSGGGGRRRSSTQLWAFLLTPNRPTTASPGRTFGAAGADALERVPAA